MSSPLVWSWMEQRASLDHGLADYRRAQEINAEAQVNLRILADRRRESDAAQRAYERALSLDPTFGPRRWTRTNGGRSSCDKGFVSFVSISREGGARGATQAYARTLLQTAPELREARQLSQELDRAGR